MILRDKLMTHVMASSHTCSSTPEQTLEGDILILTIAKAGTLCMTFLRS